MTDKWKTALAEYRKYLRTPCFVQGDLVDADPLDADADVSKVGRFIEGHAFLSQVAPEEITDAQCQLLAQAGCTWPPESGTAAWHWRRATLLTQKNYTCEYCGRTAGPSGTRGHALRMEVDHIRAKSRFENDRGAAEEWSNLTVACRSCNVVKGQADVDVFKSELIDLAQAVMRLSSD